jgi:hypothetical protein
VHRGVWWENPKDIYYVEDLGVDEMIIFKRRFKMWDGDHRTYCCGSELGTGC